MIKLNHMILKPVNVSSNISYDKPSSLPDRLDGLFDAGKNKDDILRVKFYDEYVEDILVYLVGTLCGKYHIIGEEERNNKNSIISLFQLIIPSEAPCDQEMPRLSNEDMSFIYSVVFNRIFEDRALTTKQYARIKKIFNNNENVIKNYIGEKLYSDLFLDKFFIDIEESISFNREIAFVGSGHVGIQFNYDATIHKEIKDLRSAFYVHEHKIWTISLTIINLDFIRHLCIDYNFSLCPKLELIVNNIGMFSEVGMVMDCDKEHTISYGNSHIASTFEIALLMDEDDD